MLLLETLFVSNLFLFVTCYNYDEDIQEEYGYHGVHDGFEGAKSFDNQWTVEVEGGEDVAQLVALELGYNFVGPVSGFPDTYVFLKPQHRKQRRAPSRLHTTTLIKDRRVRWAEQLFTKSRMKRYPLTNSDRTLYRVKRIEENETRILEKREMGYIRGELFNDELWDHEWYLQDTRTVDYLPRLDLNVLPVYQMGFNGNGVRVSVLDDGIEHNHTDLRANYDPEISWDSNDDDPDPLPRYSSPVMINSHGTRCAGEIAMTANNLKCGVGVAWGAKVGGVRMLDGRITDWIEGEAIGYAVDKVDIYSASWGPNDDGRTVEGPGRLALAAFKRGIKGGRGGKGSIYVWANGNGGGHKDNCNCDGYSSSIYTISIGSASQHGLFPWYGEVCSSTLATAYSSGAYKDQKIATTDTGNTCTVNHTGTSAAAPLAAGIIALALQANPDLTWRDVQHLIVWTSEYAPLSANPGWQINGAGLRFDIRFGFGLMNAGGLVKAALNWKTVPQKSICRAVSSPSDEAVLSTGESVTIIIPVEDCFVNYVEHVEVITNIRYSRRGALQISALSPQGTSVQLLSPRLLDSSTAGFVNWPLMSVATWGENPNGRWQILIEDKTNEKNIGTVGQFTVIVHGTNKMPEHMRNGPRRYDNVYNYQEVFDYFNSIIVGKGALNTVVTGDTVDIQGAQKFGNINLNEIDPKVAAEVEQELQKLYH